MPVGTGDPLQLALAHLRAHHSAVLLADETAHQVRFVLDQGRVVFPDPGHVHLADSLTLFVPREDPSDDHELQLMLAAESLDPAHPATDRWRFYHGEPRLTRWAAATIQGARFDGRVVEHEPLAAPNPLAPVEGRLLKLLNADRQRLAVLCRELATEPRDPVAVGVDPWAVDIRARFGIIRLPLPRPAPTPDEAQALITAMLQAPP